MEKEGERQGGPGRLTSSKPETVYKVQRWLGKWKHLGDGKWAQVARSGTDDMRRETLEDTGSTGKTDRNEMKIITSRHKTNR